MRIRTMCETIIGKGVGNHSIMSKLNKFCLKYLDKNTHPATVNSFQNIRGKCSPMD